jgi:hypothetical protein
MPGGTFVPPPAPKSAGTVTSYDIASMWLHDIGAPDTAPMRRAVSIWLRFEGSTVVGNNPWNLHNGPACPSGFCPFTGGLPGQVGNRYAGPGDRNVAVFGTLDAGVKANAQNLLGQKAYGYPAVIAAARAGDPVQFLTAVQNSSWSAGHYSYSKLVNALGGVFNYNFDITFRDGQGGGTTTTTNNASTLGAWGDQITFPVGHILTADDVNTIMETLIKNGWFDKFGGGPAAQITHDILVKHIGQEWNKALEDTLAAEIGQAATNANSGPLQSAAAILGALLDVQNWLYVLAFLGGLAMAGYGGKLLIAATAEPVAGAQPKSIITTQEKLPTSKPGVAKVRTTTKAA